MAYLFLKIHFADKNVTRTMKFRQSSAISTVCQLIQEKYAGISDKPSDDFGLFLSINNLKGTWLDPNRTLDYYALKNKDLLDYKKKIRPLEVWLSDNIIKTIVLDDTQIVKNLMFFICSQFGILNYEEFSLIVKNQEYKLENKILYRQEPEKGKCQLNWIDPYKTLREQNIDEKAAAILRRKFYFFDEKNQLNDPNQLDLMYVLTKEEILEGTHRINEGNACTLAAIQCQVELGDCADSNLLPGHFDSFNFLPPIYSTRQGLNKNILAEYKKLHGKCECEAKKLYIQSVWKLNTYGTTFFVVREKKRGRNQLVSCLIGVNKTSVVVAELKTNRIVRIWPLISIKRWSVGPNTFTLDFGDYDDEYYSVQTKHAELIQQLIEGYIDNICKREEPRSRKGVACDEEFVAGDENSCVYQEKITHQNKQTGDNLKIVGKPTAIRFEPEAQSWNTDHMGPAESDIFNITSATFAIRRTKAKFVPSSSPIPFCSCIEASLAATSSGKCKNRLCPVCYDLAISNFVRNVADIMGNREFLLDATEKLSLALTDLIMAANLTEKEKRDESVLNAVKSLRNAITSVSFICNVRVCRNSTIQFGLFDLTIAVANITLSVVLKASKILAVCTSLDITNKIEKAVYLCAIVSSQLGAACFKMIALRPHENGACPQILILAGNNMLKAIKLLHKFVGITCTDKYMLQEFIKASGNVSLCVNSVASLGDYTLKAFHTKNVKINVAGRKMRMPNLNNLFSLTEDSFAELCRDIEEHAENPSLFNATSCLSNAMLELIDAALQERL